MIKYLEKKEDYEVLVKDNIVLVDFYTEWCGPCKMLSTILEDIDYMDIVKVNADKFMDLAVSFGIMSVPTLLFYKNGELKEKVIGFKNSDELKEIYTKISRD